MPTANTGIPHRRLQKSAVDVPVTPFRVECKMGFKDIIHCTCGASLDLNRRGRITRAAFVRQHVECLPYVAQELHKNEG